MMGDRIRSGALVRAVALALLLLLGHAAEAAPKADLWPRWQAHDPNATATIDHSAWAAFLDRHLVVVENGANRVAYGAVSESDRAALDGYIARLEAVPISAYRRDEQMAFWINLYNAVTVQVVLEHYPVESIRDIDISPGLFSDGPWGKELVGVEGEELSLDDIEHRVLRPIWRDPRIHYVVNCASIGCPDLRPEPYRSDRLEDQLDAAARDYVNDPRGARIDDDALTVSSLYRWYQEDFGGSEPAVLEHLARHAEPALARALGGFSEIDGYRYDWRLNDEREAPGSRS